MFAALACRHPLSPRCTPVGLHNHGVRALRACVQVLMLFEALGESYYEASSNAWALSRVKPVKLITQVSMRAAAHHQPCMLR